MLLLEELDELEEVDELEEDDAELEAPAELTGAESEEAEDAAGTELDVERESVR